MSSPASSLDWPSDTVTHASGDSTPTQPHAISHFETYSDSSPEHLSTSSSPYVIHAVDDATRCTVRIFPANLPTDAVPCPAIQESMTQVADALRTEWDHNQPGARIQGPQGFLRFLNRKKIFSEYSNRLPGVESATIKIFLNADAAGARDSNPVLWSVQVPEASSLTASPYTILAIDCDDGKSQVRILPHNTPVNGIPHDAIVASMGQVGDALHTEWSQCAGRRNETLDMWSFLNGKKGFSEYSVRLPGIESAEVIVFDPRDLDGFGHEVDRLRSEWQLTAGRGTGLAESGAQGFDDEMIDPALRYL